MAQVIVHFVSSPDTVGKNKNLALKLHAHSRSNTEETNFKISTGKDN